MVSRLERWAEGARKNGFVQQAHIIENLANSFRETGVPEYFPQEAASTESSLEDRTNKFHDLRVIRAKLIEVLSIQRGWSGKPVLTSELASSINKEIGQYLEDDMLIEDLFLPSINKYQRKKQRVFSIKELKKLEQVDTPVRISYHRVLGSLIYGGYKNIGEVRNADPVRMQQVRNIGKPTLNFVKTAFARPQAGK